MTAVLAPIVVDDNRVAYFDGTATKVIELVRIWLATGETPEQLQEAFPHLSLEQVYAALSYHHGNKAELDADMRRRDRVVEHLRAEAGEHPFARRMREVGRLP